MQSSFSVPEGNESFSPSPAPRRQKRRALFWPGFAIGFGLFALATCSGVGLALGLNQLSLAELQGNGVVWTPPPYTPVPTPQPAVEAQAAAADSMRFAPQQNVRNLTSSRVNVRTTPGYLSKPSGDVIGVLQPGAVATILGESQTADNLSWWRVRTTLSDGRSIEGWVAEATASGVQILGE